MEISGKVTKKELTRYYRNIQHALQGKRNVKKKILTDFKCSVETYIENNPKTDITEIIEHFGTPQAIAEEFAASMGIDYHKRVKQNKIFKSMIVCAAIFILVCVGIICALVIENHKHSAAYYYDITITDEGEI